MLNWFKYFDQKISQILSKNASTPSNKNMPQSSKHEQTNHIFLPNPCIGCFENVLYIHDGFLKATC